MVRLLSVALIAVTACPTFTEAAGSFVCAGGRYQHLATGHRAPVAKLAQVGGTRRALVIFAGFTGDSSETPPAWAQDLLDPHLPGSVSHFYDTMSFGILELRGVVAPRIYRSEHGPSHYLAADDTSAGRFGAFAAEILRRADADVDFAFYDSDGPDGVPNSGDDDGVVDAVFLVLDRVPARFLLGNATGMGSLDWAEYWETGDRGAGGQLVRISPTQATIQQGRTFAEAAGAMSHEYGHVLGLPDLYNTEYLRTPGAPPADDSAGIGRWGLMGWGALGWQGDDGPASFCAWSRARLGWSEVVEVSEDRQLLGLTDVGQGGAICRIPRYQRGYAGEAFLLEHRRRTANYYDRHIPAEGLLIWHVMQRLPVEGEQLPPLVDLECADGRWRDAGYPLGQQPDPEGEDNLDFWAHDPEYADQHGGNLGDATDPFDGERFGAFTPETNPASLTSDGQFGLRLEPIHLEGGDVVLSIEVGLPKLEIAYIALADPESDPVWAGMEVAVEFDLVNCGGALARGLTAHLWTDDPMLEVVNTGVPLPDLRIGERGPQVERDEFPRVRVSREIEGEHEAAVSLEIRGAAGVSVVREFTVRARASHRLSGTVIGDTGEPVVGATVSISGQQAPGLHLWAVADEQGQYEAFLPAGQYMLMAVGPETARWGHVLRRVWVEADTVEDFVLPRWYLISGTVRDPEGEPLPEVALVIVGAGRSVRAVTDAEGRFAALVATVGEYTVRTAETETGYGAREIRDINVDGDVELNIELLPALHIGGVLRDGAGKAARGTVVFFSLTDGEETKVRAAADGRYSLTLVPGRYRVWTEFVGAVEQGDFTFDAGCDLDFALPSPVTLTGRVLSADGTAAVGLYLELRSLEGSGTVHALVEEDGSYMVAALPGPYHATAVRGAWTRWALGSAVLVTVPAMELEFRLPRSSLLKGRVMAADVTRLEEMTVWAYSEEGTRSEPAHPDAEGRFEMPLPDGSYHLKMSGPVGGHTVNWPAGRVGVPARDPVVLRAPEGASLSGTVTNAEGKAVYGRVWLLPAQSAPQGVSVGDHVAWSSTSFRGGSYGLCAHPGEYDLVVVPRTGMGRVMTSVRLEGEAGMDVALPVVGGQYRLWGRLLGEQGRPAPGAQLWFYAPGEGTIAKSVASELGMYSVEVPGGTSYVSACTGEEAEQGPCVSVGAIEVRANQEQDFRIAPITAVEEQVAPAELSLHQNFPNPFNGQTAIGMRVPTQGHVELTLHNLLGQRVTTLVDGTLEAGEHIVMWDGRDHAGRRLASGVYVYRLRYGELAEVRKLVLVR
ncbi:carboxypeptidase regulatory-like domain-containing protein [Candidatus Latescibacterota bacterium]